MWKQRVWGKEGAKADCLWRSGEWSVEFMPLWEGAGLKQWGAWASSGPLSPGSPP